MNCKWLEIETPDDKGLRRTRCARCGHTTAPWPGDIHHRRCPIPGWGDWVGHWLAILLGVDKPTFATWLRRLRLSNTGACGCPQRQEALNDAGWWVEKLWQRLTKKP